MKSLYDYTYDSSYRGFDIALMFDPMHPPGVHYKVVRDEIEWTSRAFQSKWDAVCDAEEYIDGVIAFQD